VRADDSAFFEGRGCYTTALVRAGRPRWLERHAERLSGSASQLGLGALAPERVRTAISELARAAFGDGDGIVRMQASRDPDGNLHLVGVPRPVGEEPDMWSAILVPLPHSGGGLARGLKVSSRLTMALAGDAAREAGAQEALLLDASGRLVEGSRSNILVSSEPDSLVTPPLAFGAVAGIARSLALERVAGIVEREVTADELRRANEIVAVNAVRGARPITTLDGKPVGDGTPGPWAKRLREVLDTD
jgi:branched-subunit amino acid aminotransferase/4-amino-4-deoxychorismate lyase